MASSLPSTPRSSVSAPRPTLLAPPDQLSAPQSCPSSAMPSPAPSTEASLAPSNSVPPSEASARDEPDTSIVEALNGSKDRLFVLKLGEDFDTLLSERGNTPGKRCTYSMPSTYQRMLVYRCAQYYRLVIEADGKTISVSVGAESRVPKSRIAEIAPQEKAATPAFKIMRRTADERARARQPGRSDSTEDDQGDGIGGIDEAKRRAQMTIEERTAAYEQARSRIFEGFQEKESQPSPPPVKRDSGNSESRWGDKQRRSDLSSSSRGSPIPQDMATPAQYHPLLFNPHAPSGQAQSAQQYDPSAASAMQYTMYGGQPSYYSQYSYYQQPQFDPRQGLPVMQMYQPPPQGPYPHFPPHHAATWPQPPHSQPQPQPIHYQPQPQAQQQMQMQGHIDAHRHAFPQMMHPQQQQQHGRQGQMPPPMHPQMHANMQMAPQQSQGDPFPPAKYMQPHHFNGMMHQPVLIPTPHEGSSSSHSSRSVSRNGHGHGHGSMGSNGGGTKGPRTSAHTPAWSTSTVATPMRSVVGTNRRLSASSSSASAYSSSGGGAGSGSGSRTPADETASVASSTSSSSSRRTYTSTSTTSKHPLPPRPDWAVGLLNDPPLSRATSSSSNDSRLRLASRSSSSNQIPRASSVKLNSVTNASDFPPLNGSGNGNMGGPNGTSNNGVRVGTGAWARDAPSAALFGNSIGQGAGGPMGVGMNGNSSTGSLNANNSPGGNPSNVGGANANANPRRFEATEAFERPAPKSFGLYNPSTGTGPAALPMQVRSVQESGLNQGSGANFNTQAGVGETLAEQVAKMSVGDGAQVTNGA